MSLSVTCHQVTRATMRRVVYDIDLERGFFHIGSFPRRSIFRVIFVVMAEAPSFSRGPTVGWSLVWGLQRELLRWTRDGSTRSWARYRGRYAKEGLLGLMVVSKLMIEKCGSSVGEDLLVFGFVVRDLRVEVVWQAMHAVIQNRIQRRSICMNYQMVIITY